MSSDDFDKRLLARLAVVDEHISAENLHDLDGIMGTFGKSARYDDEPWNAHYVGRDQVSGFYADLLKALPDLRIRVVKRYPCADAVVLEVVVAGHHSNTWRGLPATGARVEFPLCAIFTFDEADRLAGEKIYYDRASILRQLGIFHEPEAPLGRLNALLLHPITIGRILRWNLSGRTQRSTIEPPDR
jgi:steroid delta-isomerase-like uncharacterized protein